MKYLIVIFNILFFCNFSKAKTFCEKNQVFCQIVKNNPKIDLDYAMELSNVIYEAASEFNVKPKRLAAILAQESQYKLDAININKDNCKDYGISQINCRTVKLYNFDKQKLLTDLRYSVKAGAMVLSDLKKSFRHELDYWCRYNVGTRPKHRIQNSCEVYKNLVMRYM